VLEVSDTVQFSAVGTDAGGNVIAITPTWTLVAGGGVLDAAGFFTAGIISATYTNTIRAMSGAISGFATVIINEPPPLIDLGAAATHGILAGSAITCVTLGTVDGDASVSPGTALSNFPPCTVAGQQHLNDAYALAAQTALTSAYNQLVALACDAVITGDLAGQTFTPGVYCSASSIGLTGAVTLDALGDPNASFVFQATSTFITATATINLQGLAQAKNIYWLVGSSATFGTGSAVKGNIIALTAITLNDSATLLGRALARNGAVSLGTSNTITLP
jgi:hypothetical protein